MKEEKKSTPAQIDFDALSIDEQILILQSQEEILKAKKIEVKACLDELLQHFKSLQNQSDSQKREELFQKGRAYDSEYHQIIDELNKISDKLQALQLEKSEKDAARRKAEEERIAREEAERKQAQAKAQWADDEALLRGTGKKNRVADTAEKILDKLKVQIVPSTVCVEMNEKLTKRLFNIPDEWNQKLLNNGTKMIITEKKRHTTKKGKVKDAIESRYTMRNAEGYDDQSPLTEFDRAVLGVVVSEYLAGNLYTTVNVIYRALTGKVGEVAAVPMKNQKEAIINSVIKLMAKIVDFSKFTESYEQMNYTDKNGNELKFGVESLLSAGIVDAVVNGQEMEGVIYFKDQSPLFDLADAKNQVIRYPHELLDVPNQNNTPLVITLKKYVMRRICEIKLHKQLTPTITFTDVFKKCRVNDNDSREQKRRRRNVILKFVEHLQEKEFIKTFEVISKNGLIHGITFTF